MARAAIILTALIALLPASSLEVVSNNDDVTQNDAGTVIFGANVSQTATVNWALQRFGDTGIPLPPLQIYVHESRASCRDHDGLFTPRNDIDRLDLCSDVPFILLHELAHAWDVNFGTDSARRTLLEAWGAKRWSGGDVDYRQRGEEKAANLIAVGLIDSPLTESEAAANRATLLDFEMLTGVTSPRYEGALADLVVPARIDTAGLAAQYAARTQNQG